MPKIHRGLSPDMEGVYNSMTLPIDNNEGFMDIVSKFGPLIVAIIAVAFCFYIYNKVIEMNNNTNNYENFINDQFQTNFKIQESYNTMVEQVNKLSSVVHSSMINDGTIQTQISPSPSTFNEPISVDLNNGLQISDFNTDDSIKITLQDEDKNTLKSDQVSDVGDEESVLSVTQTKSKKHRKLKKEVNL